MEDEMIEAEVVTCTTCSGEGQYLGTLGSLAWYRCTCCGMEFNQQD